jgi:hypothetical protein
MNDNEAIPSSAARRQPTTRGAIRYLQRIQSYFCRDVNEQQLRQARGDRASAAQSGCAYSILILAVLLDHGSTVKRDNAPCDRCW